MQERKIKKYKWLKVTASIIGILLIALIAAAIWLQTDSGENFVRLKLVAYLQKKIGRGSIKVGALKYHIPTSVELNNVLVINNTKDTLLDAQLLYCNLNMLQLIKGTVIINNLQLKNTRANISKNANDSTFNFQYIINAFASKNKDTASSKKATDLTIKIITLDSVYVNFNDANQQLFCKAFIGNLHTTIDKLDIDKLHFVITKFSLNNSSVWLLDNNTKKEKVSTSSSTSKAPSSTFTCLVNDLNVHRLKVNYHNVLSKITYTNLVDTLALTKSSLDVANTSFFAEAITLNNSAFSLATNKPNVIVKDTLALVVDIASKKGWDVKINAININHNQVAINNDAFAVNTATFDYNHLMLNDVSLKTKQVHYNSDTIDANVLSGNIFTKQIWLQNLHGNIFLDYQKASLQGIEIRTANSLINANGNIIFNRNTKNETLNNNTRIGININQSYVGFNEVLYFLPLLKRSLPITLKPKQTLAITGKIEGTMQALNIALLNAKTTDGKILLNAKGSINNLLQTKQLGYNLAINKLYLDKSILSTSVQQQLQQLRVNLPQTIQVSGMAKGSLTAINTQLTLLSTFGLANINATANGFNNIKSMRYAIDLTGKELQTGKWIYRDSLLGLFNGTIKIKGNSTDYKQATIETNTVIKSLVVKGYNYTNVALNAQLKNGHFNLKGNINDTNLISDINVAGTVNQAYPTLKGIIAVNKADLKKLNITPDSINISTAIVIDAQDLNPKSLQATLLLDSSIISYKGKALFADTLSIKGNAANDSTKIYVKAPFLQASLVGKYDYQHLPVAITAFIKHHYLKENTDSLNVQDQQAILNATFIQDAIMQQMAPNIVIEQPAVVYAAFNNATKDTSLTIKVAVPSVSAGTTTINNINVTAYGIDSVAKFSLNTSDIMADGKKFYKAAITGTFIDTTLALALTTENAKQQKIYALNSIITLLKDGTRIHLGDTLLLNNNQWQVAANNAITIKKGGYIVSNLAINKANQSLLIANKEANTTSPIIVKIDNFRLGEILAISDADTSMMTGILNTDMAINQPINSLPSVLGKIEVEAFTYQKVPIGNIALNTTIDNNQAISVKGNISGPNTLSIDGGYNTKDKSFALSTQIDKLNVDAIQSFSQGQITRAKGIVHGNIYANGTINEPRWRGELSFDSTQFATELFGALYKIDKQTIDLEYPNIGLYEFTINDSLNHSLVIDGTIKRNVGKPFSLDLSVNTKNFIAVNQPRTPNAMVYGVGIINTAIQVGGTSSIPDISGNITLNNKSDVHYVMPSKNNYKDDLKQIVKFIDVDTIKSFSNRNNIFTNTDSTISLKHTGVKYNLNLEVQEDANVTVLMDPASGDELNIKGKATLNAGVDENGIIGLTGVYQLKDGAYNLSYQFIKKRFKLIEGSTITFSGNPQEAQADITAYYEVETSPKELLGNEIAENSADLGSAYNTKVPFDVVLKIKGAITKPELSFDIKVKDNAEGVNTTLSTTIDNKLTQYRNDASEMNKQVFALLILGRFVGDRSSDFFASSNSGGTSTNDVVKESVSKFLAEAVNQIAADLVKGVDINLDLKNYQGDAATNTASRTDVNVELSKQLLNDRLIVTVGKSFTIDGDDPLAKTQNNSNLQFLPDITTTYKLSKDGKYALRAYRKNQYEAILDGYFTETGVAFTLTMNYEKFKELFQKGKKKNKKQATK